MALPVSSDGSVSGDSSGQGSAIQVLIQLLKVAIRGGVVVLRGRRLVIRIRIGRWRTVRLRPCRAAAESRPRTAGWTVSTGRVLLPLWSWFVFAGMVRVFLLWHFFSLLLRLLRWLFAARRIPRRPPGREVEEMLVSGRCRVITLGNPWWDVHVLISGHVGVAAGLVHEIAPWNRLFHLSMPNMG